MILQCVASLDSPTNMKTMSQDYSEMPIQRHSYINQSESYDAGGFAHSQALAAYAEWMVSEGY